MELKKVNAKEIVFYQFTDNVLVIVGNEVIPFEWKNADNVDGGNISLYDLQEQLADKYYCFMVLAESPLKGSIYRFNNYGQNEWYKVGIMRGYA